MPFVKMPDEGAIYMIMRFGNLLITSAQPLQGICIRQFIPLSVVAFATSEDKVPSPIFQNECPRQYMIDF